MRVAMVAMVTGSAAAGVMRGMALGRQVMGVAATLCPYPQLAPTNRHCTPHAMHKKWLPKWHSLWQGDHMLPEAAAAAVLLPVINGEELRGVWGKAGGDEGMSQLYLPWQVRAYVRDRASSTAALHESVHPPPPPPSRQAADCWWMQVKVTCPLEGARVSLLLTLRRKIRASFCGAKSTAQSLNVSETRLARQLAGPLSIA